MEDRLSDLILRRNALVGFVAAICLTAMLAGFSLWTVSQASADAAWVGDTHAILGTLEAILGHLGDIDTGSRGFELTGDPPFLELYAVGKDAVPTDLQRLGDKVRDRHQLQFLRALRQQAQVRIANAADLVALRQSSGRAPAPQQIDSDKQAMDQVRQTVQQMQAGQRQLLTERSERSHRSQHFALVTVTSASLLGIIFLSIAGFTVHQEIHVIATTRAHIRALNAELEVRVQQRTAALAFEIETHRATQTELRASEERFQGMANGIPQLAWIAAAQGSISWYNQRWYQFSGTTPEQMLGISWHDFLHGALREEVVAAWQHAVATGQPFDMEIPLRGADGLLHVFLTRVMPLKDRAGQVISWFGTHTDISERKQFEQQLVAQTRELSRRAEDLFRSQQALKEQKQMLQWVLDSTEEGLVAADEQGRFLLWNPAAEQIMGLGAADLSPAEWSDHYGVYEADEVTLLPLDRHPLLRAIRGETSTTELVFKNSKLPSAVYVEMNGAPLRNEDGSIRGGVVAFRNITRRKADERKILQLNQELEKRIAQRTAQLEAANGELASFCYSVSHDLRAPLRHISGFSRILMGDLGPALEVEPRGHLQTIEDAVMRMGSLMDGLLSLARLGQQSLQLRSTNLNTLVQAVIGTLQPACDESGHQREVEWRVAQLPTLPCDPKLMSEVLQQLIGNALKFSAGRSHALIEVGSMQQPNAATVIFVRDNGVGFDMKYAQKLFGVFQRMHTSEEFTGIGVGLATVHRIIEKHGGKIWADAEPSRGATFYFTLGENQGVQNGTHFEQTSIV